MIADQFGERRARHQHAFVDIKLETAKPGFASNIGGGLARVDAQFENLDDLLALLERQRAAEIIVGPVIG